VSTRLETHYEVVSWLDREAELLDEQRFDEWLDLLADDVRYILPTTVTLDRGAGPALGAMAHFDEDRYSLGKRVERLLGAHAWTEDPPSRTRRFVTNVRVSEDGSMLSARSYLLLYRSRGDDRRADLVSAERRDRLRRVDGELRLARRDVVVDDAVLRTQNLALFL
jgi:phthalate 3,4-dioxygenase subunit beta